MQKVQKVMEELSIDEKELLFRDENKKLSYYRVSFLDSDLK